MPAHSIHPTARFLLHHASTLVAARCVPVFRGAVAKGVPARAFHRLSAIMTQRLGGIKPLVTDLSTQPVLNPVPEPEHPIP